jgi:Flp pilus assembly pilin Flp
MSRMLVREEAQTMAEYAVVLGVITMAVVTSFALLSGSILRAYELVANVFS